MFLKACSNTVSDLHELACQYQDNLWTKHGEVSHAAHPFTGTGRAAIAVGRQRIATAPRPVFSLPHGQCSRHPRESVYPDAMTGCSTQRVKVGVNQFS